MDMIEQQFNIGDRLYSKTWERDVMIQEILPNCFYKVVDIHGVEYITHESSLWTEKITVQKISNANKLFKYI